MKCWTFHELIISTHFVLMLVSLLLFKWQLYVPDLLSMKLLSVPDVFEIIPNLWFKIRIVTPLNCSYKVSLLVSNFTSLITLFSQGITSMILPRCHVTWCFPSACTKTTCPTLTSSLNFFIFIFEDSRSPNYSCSNPEFLPYFWNIFATVQTGYLKQISIRDLISSKGLDKHGWRPWF